MSNAVAAQWDGVMHIVRCDLDILCSIKSILAKRQSSVDIIVKSEQRVNTLSIPGVRDRGWVEPQMAAETDDIKL